MWPVRAYVVNPADLAPHTDLSILYMLSSHLLSRSFVPAFPCLEHSVPDLCRPGRVLSLLFCWCDILKLSQTTHLVITQIIPLVSPVFWSIYHSLKIYLFICTSMHANPPLLWSKLHGSRPYHSCSPLYLQDLDLSLAQNGHLHVSWMMNEFMECDENLHSSITE